MPLLRNRIKFKQDITALLKAGSKQAFLETYNTTYSETETAATLAEKMSVKFSESFAQAVGNDLATLIDTQIDEQGFNVTGLTAGGNPVSGVLTSL